jgi:hypothetical protein
MCNNFASCTEAIFVGKHTTDMKTSSSEVHYLGTTVKNCSLQPEPKRYNMQLYTSLLSYVRLVVGSLSDGKNMRGLLEQNTDEDIWV